jgi:hypothetical protein
MAHSTRSRALALALALLAVCLPPAIRFLTAPLATVHVRWQPSIDQAARRQFETRFRLVDGRRLDQDTWRYGLEDTSRSNIRALVLDPAIADTHYLDRSTYALDRSAPVVARPTRFPIAAPLLTRVVDWTAVVLLAFAALLLSGRHPAWIGAWQPISHGFRQRATAGRGVIAAIERWLAPWIPELDVHALGAFRVALGVGFLWIAWTTVVVPVPVERLQHRAWIDLDVVHQIAASPQACDALEIVMLASALLFTIGVWTRPAYAGFVAAFFLATLIKLEVNSSHDLGLPLVTFVGWLTVPWDRGRARRRSFSEGGSSSAGGPSRACGFAIWWPGLTLGLAMLAAAYAKLHQSGLAWITGGAVKYHFVTDAGNTRVDWGLWVASHERVAVLISLAAIVIEAALILNVFARGPRMRLAAGAACAGLFAGLYLFQGIYWRPWLVLLLAFLPWAWLNRVPPSPARVATTVDPTPLRAPQIVAVAIFAMAQVYASAAQIEAEPLLSNFPMYASTYASPEDFERSIRWELTRLVEARGDGQDIAHTLDGLREDDRFLLMELAEQGLPQGERLTEGQRRRLALLCESYRRASGTLPTEVRVTLERRGFDWQAGGFREYRPVATLPVPLAAVCHRLPG